MTNIEMGGEHFAKMLAAEQEKKQNEKGMKELGKAIALRATLNELVEHMDRLLPNYKEVALAELTEIGRNINENPFSVYKLDAWFTKWIGEVNKAEEEKRGQ